MALAIEQKEVKPGVAVAARQENLLGLAFHPEGPGIGLQAPGV
jgi:glutamine amidotransferase PdxT